MQESKPIPVILGQTATGKTSIGIELSRLMNGEVISIDSRKVYEGLEIGTATPSGERKSGALIVEGIPHHLMGFLKPDKPYNAGDFAVDAERLIQEILARGKTPVLVGGTGFYFKALQQGLPPLPKADAEFRTDLEKKDVEVIRKELESIDPEAAQAITPRDRHKIIRALEVHHLTGLPFSQWKSQSKGPSKHRFVVMGLQYERNGLEKRIEERSQQMFDQGMIEETEAVLKKGYAPDCHALASFGYREAVQVIQGSLPRKEFLPLLIKGTKAYAKRQRTWFRTQVKPAWFVCDGSLDKQQIAMRMKAFCYTPTA